jgi:hypothetical protein
VSVEEKYPGIMNKFGTIMDKINSYPELDISSLFQSVTNKTFAFHCGIWYDLILPDNSEAAI